MGLGSGIRKKPIPDPGVQKASDPGSRTLASKNVFYLIKGPVTFFIIGGNVEEPKAYRLIPFTPPPPPLPGHFSNSIAQMFKTADEDVL